MAGIAYVHTEQLPEDPVTELGLPADKAWMLGVDSVASFLRAVDANHAYRLYRGTRGPILSIYFFLYYWL